MFSYLPTNHPPPLRGGADLHPLTHGQERTDLHRLPAAPPRVQMQEGPVSLPRTAAEVARRPALSGVRALVQDSPGTVDGPGQTPWTLYAVNIGAPTFGGWSDDCSCDEVPA